MLKYLMTNVQMTELMPDEEGQQEGAKHYRLLQYEDGDRGGKDAKFLVWELYEAEYVLEEGGDAETGPQCYLVLDDWKNIGGGMGHMKSIEDAISLCEHCPYPD